MCSMTARGCCWAQYTITLRQEQERDALQAYLKAQNIPSAVYYRKPMHRQGAYAHLDLGDERYPVSLKLSETALSLPMHPYLSANEVERVCAAVKRFFNG